MTVFAYLRVSTDNKGQTTDNQRKLIEDAGFAIGQFHSEDGISGSKPAFSRPVFSFMYKQMKEGDTLLVTAVDRLGRSAHDILSVVEEFKARGIKLRVMQFDGIDITSPTGKMILTCMAAMAELERNLLIERTKAGMARTKQQGTKLGRSMVVNPTQLGVLVMAKKAGTSVDEVAKDFGISRTTAFRLVRQWGDNLDGYKAEWEARETQYASKED